MNKQETLEKILKEMEDKKIGLAWGITPLGYSYEDGLYDGFEEAQKIVKKYLYYSNCI